MTSSHPSTRAPSEGSTTKFSDSTRGSFHGALLDRTTNSVQSVHSLAIEIPPEDIDFSIEHAISSITIKGHRGCIRTGSRLDGSFANKHQHPGPGPARRAGLCHLGGREACRPIR